MISSPKNGFVLLASLKGTDRATAQVAANIARIEMGEQPKPLEFLREIKKPKLLSRLIVKGVLWLNRTRH